METLGSTFETEEELTVRAPLQAQLQAFHSLFPTFLLLKVLDDKCCFKAWGKSLTDFMSPVEKKTNKQKHLGNMKIWDHHHPVYLYENQNMSPFLLTHTPETNKQTKNYPMVSNDNTAQ